MSVTAEKAVRVLDGTFPTSEGFGATCPCHDDARASLGVRQDGDTLLIRCHAGCRFTDILAAIKERLKDGYEGTSGSRPSGSRTKKQAADTDYLQRLEKHRGPAIHLLKDLPANTQIWEIVNMLGDHAYFVVKFRGKKFCQAVYDPEQPMGLLFGRHGRTLYLYNLPALVTAIRRGERVFVCEGEKDCQRLMRLGHTATCNTGGAGEWKDWWNEYFRGDTRVVVVADNDEPGIAHAQTVAESIRKVNSNVVIMRAASGKDAADHLDAGHGVDDFVEF